MFGVQEANVTKDNFIHELAAVGSGERDRGNARHWRVIFGGVSAVVIVWPRWRENLMEAKRRPATPEEEEAVYGSSLRVNKALLFPGPPPPPLYSRGCLLGTGGPREGAWPCSGVETREGEEPERRW